ncbi:hypothetical protein TNCV_4138021 [Trichonephila clavipes]|nr:hypothetical protein TNCV_4138021 [Trichonephila clavipes]
MPKEVEELVFVWASRLSPYPWVRFDYPFPFVISSLDWRAVVEGSSVELKPLQQSRPLGREYDGLQAT